MKFDELKKCPCGESDACYSQEVNEEINIEFCYGCGFQHNTLMTSGSQFMEEQLSVLPDLYKTLMGEEKENGKIWMPSYINVDGKGMVFADGTGRDNWAWAGVKATEVKEDEVEKFKGAKYKPDMSTIKHFKERDYIEALSYIGVLPE